MILTHMMKKKTNMDTQAMNEEWINDSLYDAEYILENYSIEEDELNELNESDYRIVIGLFETDWMQHDHTRYRKGEYGYPR